MKITIICVGKIKEDYLKKAIAEYEKRLGRYCRLEIVEVPDEKTPDGISLLMEDQIKEKEAERILHYIREDAYLCTLEIKGKQPDSIEFAEKLNDLAIHGISHIQFVIGGSLGLHKKISEISDEKLSFSNMTFPHQLMRVILLEQIYRAYRINMGEPYHK